MTKLLHFSLRGMVHGLVWGTADILLRISASGVRPSERVAARPSASGDAFPRQRRCVNTQARYIPVLSWEHIDCTYVDRLKHISASFKMMD